MKELTSEELKQVQIDIMKYVHNFCEKNGIKYFICSGTLIGAARHKGFIPWDDDIDIMMPRDDYERFISLFSKEEGRFKVWSHKLQKHYPLPYAKVTDENTLKIENMVGAIELGVDIDVFPLDDIPDDDNLFAKVVKKGQYYNHLLGLKQTTLRKGRKFYKNAILIIGRLLLYFYPTLTILRKIDKNAMKFHGCEGSRTADLVFPIAGMKEVQRKDYYEETMLLPFEDEMFIVPRMYHEFLTARYGDYMKLPPVELQVTHHSFVAYWKEGQSNESNPSILESTDPSYFTI